MLPDALDLPLSFEGARAALLSAQCVLCHRVSNDPSFPNSVIGPEVAVELGLNAREVGFVRHGYLGSGTAWASCGGVGRRGTTAPVLAGQHRSIALPSGHRGHASRIRAHRGRVEVMPGHGARDTGMNVS